MCKDCLWVGYFQEEIRDFIFFEPNKEVVMNIFKMEDLFGMFFFLIYVHDTIIL